MGHPTAVLVGAVTTIASVLLPLHGQAAAPGPEPQGYLRVVHAYPADADRPLDVSVDGTPAGAADWVGATPWIAVGPGIHQVRVVAGLSDHTGAVEAPAGCRVTVFATQPDVTSSTVGLVTAVDCLRERIPSGHAQVTTVLVANADFGPVEVRVGDANLPVVPFEPHLGATVPAGETELAVGTPGGAEQFAVETPRLLADTAYTVLWAGGGETPSRLVVLVDAAQSADPPPPGVVVNTGQPADGGWAPAAVVAAAVTAFLARRLRRVAAVVLAVVVVAGCDTPVAPAPPRPPPAVTAAPAPTSAPRPSSSPARVAIPAIGLDQAIITMPTEAIRGLPDSLPLADIAWVEGTAPPGALGTMALLAHTTAGGSGAFAALPGLRVGDSVSIVDVRGRTHRYTVRATGTVPKTAFPAWVWAPQPVPSVVLITCTRERKPVTGVADNQLVWATETEGPP